MTEVGSSPKPRPNSFWQVLSLFLRGVFMGAADIVPGISGGTIAFITGIYEDLLVSIKTINAKSLKSFFLFRWGEFFTIVAWEFLLVLGLGITLAIVTVANLFAWLLNEEAYCAFLYAGFLGLICGSIVYCAKQIDKWGIPVYLALVLGWSAAFLLTMNSSDSWQKQATYNVYLPLEDQSVVMGEKVLSNYNVDTSMLLDVPENVLHVMLAKGRIGENSPVWNTQTGEGKFAGELIPSTSPYAFDFWVFFCGAIAVCAMLLPGVSGSYLLNVLGMYGVVIAAVVEFTEGLGNGNFEKSAFITLFTLFLGIAFGATVFSRVLTWLFQRYRQVTIALLTGFMIGALRSVWPFWTHSFILSPLRIEAGAKLLFVDPIVPDLADPQLWIAGTIVALTFFAVITIEYIAKLMKSNRLQAPSKS
ncbi:MAG: putative membrane protein [Chlamydiales bacterium]|jgi:putative membrane protein